MIEVIFVTNGGKTVTAPENSNLLRVSLREKGGIPFKCGGGLCGTCKCLIEKGIENTDAIKPKERKHLTEEQFAAGYRMACQTFLNGDVSVSWIPKPVAVPNTFAANRRLLTANDNGLMVYKRQFKYGVVAVSLKFDNWLDLVSRFG